MRSSELLERHALGNGIPVYVYRHRHETSGEKKGDQEDQAEAVADETVEEKNEPCWIAAVLPRVGSCADPPDAPGTAHFREHVAFQGTASHPTCEALIRALGHSFKKRDGRTDKSWTAYGLNLAGDKLPAIVPILGEVVTSPLIDAERVAHERDIIEAEYRERLSGRWPIHDLELRRQFHDDYAFGHSTIGTLDSIRGMTVPTVLNFQHRYYHAGNLVIGCTGDLPPNDQLLAQLESAFGCLRRDEPFVPIFPALPYGREAEAHDPRFLFDSLVVSYPMPLPDLRARVVWNVLVSYLNRDAPEAMGFELRERRRLVYGTTYARFGTMFQHAVLNFVIPVQRHHFAVARRVLDETLAAMTEAQWLESPDRAANRIRTPPKPRKKPVHPNSAFRKINDALCNGDDLATALDCEINEHDITWADVDACRRQLLSTKPFIFRALA